MAKTDDPTLISVAGPYLKELRIGAGQQQRQFADAYDLEPSMLSKLENGQGQGPKRLPRIVEAYAEVADISAHEAWAEIGKRLSSAERDRETSQRAQQRAAEAEQTKRDKKQRRGQGQ